MKLSIVFLFILAFNSILYAQILEKSISPGVRIAEKKLSQLKEYSLADTVPMVFYYEKQKQNQHQNNALIIVNGKPAGTGLSGLMHSDQIEDIKIEKEKFLFEGKDYYGKIIVKTKSDYTPKIIRLNELVKKYTDLSSDNYICSLDSKIIQEVTDDIYVDEKYIMKIEVHDKQVSSGETFSFISILTRSSGNLKEANKIYIRGSGL